MKLNENILLWLILELSPLAAQGQFTTVEGGDNTLAITGYTGSGGNVEVPSIIDSLPVTSIGDYAFQSVTSLTGLTIPDSVTSIGHNAFAFCTGQTRVTLGNGVTTIGVNAFYGNTSLTNVTIGKGITTLENGAFQQCSSLYAVYFAGNAPSAVADNVFTGDPVTVYRNTDATGWSSTLAGRPVAISDQAPHITGQPTNQSVVVGDTVMLTVTATGMMPLLYQWRKDGTPIVGATDFAYTLTGVTNTDAGYYDVVVSNQFGSTQSSLAALQVLPFGAPSISVNGQIAVGTFSTIAPATATVTITGGFANGFIFYTLDGTTPNLGSTYYTGPFILTNDARVVAMSLNANLVQTSVAPMVTVLILPTYSLTTSAVGSGTVGASPSQAAYPSNSVVTLTAYPSVHFAFDHWSGDIAGSANPATVTMNGPRSVQATFIPSEYPLTLSTPGGGTVTANGQSISPNTWYSVTSVVSLAAIPDPGWGFLRWEGSVTSTDNPLLLPMNQSNDVHAIFGTTMLNVSTPGGGTVTADGQSIPPNTEYPPGTLVSLAATPDSGWGFLRWEGSVTSTDNPLLLRMDQTNTLQAVFGTMVRTVVAGSGSILLNPTNPVPYGTTVTATAVPTAGYAFLAWSGAVSGHVNPTSILVTVSSPLIGAVFTGPPVPVIVDQPTNLTVVVSQSAAFSVTVSGAVPLSYQWSQATNPIVNATNAVYLITNTAAADAGNYTVVVSNAYGSVTSDVAVLTIVFPPSIDNPPVSQTLAAGSDLILTVQASGTEPLYFQWRNEAGLIPDATNATYELNPVGTNAAGDYAVVVTNAYGAVTSSVASVVVFIPVTITIPPLTQVVPARGTATFQVGATGYPAPNYLWLFMGKAIPGADGSSLVITNVGTNALGEYQVVAWNTYSAASNSAQLVMSPSLRAPFVGLTALWGKTATLSVSALGSGPLSYQWFKDGEPVEGATSNKLSFATVQISDGGLYSVVVSSPWGSVTNVPAQLVVNPANIALGLYAGVTIEGVPGYTYGIQFTTDLRDTNSWVTATNLTLAEPVQLWLDTSVKANSPTNPPRFYRVIGQ